MAVTVRGVLDPASPVALRVGSALAFSPNGAWLAAQAAHSTREPAAGLVDVVDLRSGARGAQCPSPAVVPRLTDGNKMAPMASSPEEARRSERLMQATMPTAGPGARAAEAPSSEFLTFRLGAESSGIESLRLSRVVRNHFSFRMMWSMHSAMPLATAWSISAWERTSATMLSAPVIGSTRKTWQAPFSNSLSPLLPS